MADDVPILRVAGVARQVFLNGESLAILHPLDFEVWRGESVAILGASGSGKSTLLVLLAGLDPPSQGEGWLAGQSLNALD